MASNPMHQFSVYKIGPEIKINGVDLSFTNASLFMLISATLILLFLLFGTKEKKIIPNKVQLISEILYSFVSKMISDTAGKKAKPYFPFIFSLFIFILFCNMVGMLPYSFTVTSHIIVTLAFALFVFSAKSSSETAMARNSPRESQRKCPSSTNCWMCLGADPPAPVSKSPPPASRGTMDSIFALVPSSRIGKRSVR